MARARYNSMALTADGLPVNIVPNATVTLYEAGTTTPLSDTIYAGATGGSTLTNPFTADAYGNFTFYLATAKRVKITTTGTGVGTFTNDYEPVLADPEDLLTMVFETPLTNVLPVQDGDDYTMLGLSEGSTSPSSALLAPMLNFQRRVAHNAVDTTNVSDYYFQSVRYGSLEQSLLTCSGGSSTTITKSGAGWTTNQFAGMQIDLVGGTGSGQRKIVASNTSDTITITGTFSPVPVNGSTTFVINDGGAYDLYTFAVYAIDNSDAKPMNGEHGTIALAGFAKQASSSNGSVYGGLLLGELGSVDGKSFGLEIDVVNNSGATALAYPSSVKQSIGLNIASFASPSGYSGTNNSLGILVQADGANGALLTGMLWGANSVKTGGVVIDFSPLTAGATTPYPLRIGSGHQILGKDSSGVDVGILHWATDNTLKVRSTSGTIFESNAGAEWARINSGGLALLKGSGGAPAANFVLFYPKSDDNLYKQTSAGDEVRILDADIFSAAGQLIYGTGAETFAALAAGTTSQVLIGGTTPSWGSVATGMLAANATTQRGTKTATGSGVATTNSSSFVTMLDDTLSTEMSVTLTTTGGDVMAFFSGVVLNNTSGGINAIGFSLDGADTTDLMAFTAPAVNAYGNHACFYLWTGVSAASHTVRVRWRTVSGTASAYGRALIVMEFKK